MRPTVGLGRPHRRLSPNAESLLVVSGKVRYTGINVNPQPFKDGKLSICEENGLYFIICNGKAKRRFQLSKRIQSISTRTGHITIVLSDGFQIIAKECEEENFNLFKLSLNEIKDFGSLKSLASKKGCLSAEDKRHSSLGSSDGIVSNVKKISPHSMQGKNPWISSPSFSTPSKSPHPRGKQLCTVKGRLLDTPLCNKENTNARDMPNDHFSIEDEEVSLITKASHAGSWSRPPGEKSTHSPALKYRCSPSSSPLGFSTVQARSPKCSKRMTQQQKTYSPNERDTHNIDEFGEGNNWSSSASKRSFMYKRTYGSRKNASPSPLRTKVLQEENQISAHRSSSEQNEATHKASSFYGSQKPSLYSSLSGKKFQNFNWTGRGLKRLSLNCSQKRDSTSSPINTSNGVSNQINQSALTGFANLGNTCYMNAILQCLLGIPVFAHDLESPFLLQNVLKPSLYSCLHALEKAKRKNESQEKQQLILKYVKRAISNKAARFSGEMQHDAHEFLGQCLDQLKDDIMKTLEDDKDTTGEIHLNERKTREAACPVARNFECQITHNIKCTECGNKITKEEVFYDFSLDIPERDENTDPDDKDIQELLQEYFKEETIEYKCEDCEHESALFSHHISRLPRVIILHLKRYELHSSCSKYIKKLDSVDVPLEIDLGALCTEKTTKPLHFDKTPKGGIKRAVSNETPDDINDLQPCFKARRKLSLPPNPVLSNPENEESGLAFEQDSEKAINLSLDTATEEEQLEWALAESMRTGQQSVSEMKNGIDDYEIESMSRNGDRDFMKYTDIIDNTNSFETFTGLREKNKQITEVEASNMYDEKTENGKNIMVLEGLSAQDKRTGIENASYLVEGTSQEDSEDYQLKLALELSLQEYNKQSTEKPKLLEMQCRSNETVKMAKKRKKVAADANGVNRKYRLIGVVSHIGDSSVVGHYTSDVYDCKESEWKSYDDLNVKKISDSEIQYGRKKSAYILFYIDEMCFKLITNTSQKSSS